MAAMSNQRHRNGKRECCDIRIVLRWPLVDSIPFTELAIVLILVVSFYILASTLDFSEKWVDWSAEYEHFEIDELPLGFGFASLALAWFSWRRCRA